MKKYRIKIIERHNGDICYIPQFGMSNIWSNIVFLINPITGNTMKQVRINAVLEKEFDTEEEALKMINQHKIQEEIDEGFKIKTTTYKDIL
jgi:hypothetical protein